MALAERAVREQKENFTAPLGNDVFQFSAFPFGRKSHAALFRAGRPLLCGRRTYREIGREATAIFRRMTAVPLSEERKTGGYG